MQLVSRLACVIPMSDSLYSLNVAMRGLIYATREPFALVDDCNCGSSAISSPAAAQDQPFRPTRTRPRSKTPRSRRRTPMLRKAPKRAPNGENAIVVTGLRRALQSARNIKRNSDQIVDTIVAEDIGKLPDITVSDSAARIPGIQVERERGEAGRVLVRGLDNTFYTTTYDGRELFTAETRRSRCRTSPPEQSAAIEAFKTSTANLVEPGISGLSTSARGGRSTSAGWRFPDHSG